MLVHVLDLVFSLCTLTIFLLSLLIQIRCILHAVIYYSVYDMVFQWFKSVLKNNWYHCMMHLIAHIFMSEIIVQIILSFKID